MAEVIEPSEVRLGDQLQVVLHYPAWDDGHESPAEDVMYKGEVTHKNNLRITLSGPEGAVISLDDPALPCTITRI
jgi:hypothetical protein